MPNYCNKITYYGRDLIDLTADTVTPDLLCNGTTAHAANGSIITGTAAVSVTTDSQTGETGIIFPAAFLSIGQNGGS